MKYGFLPEITGSILIDGILYVVGLALLSWGVYEIYWHIKYRKEYSEIKHDKGVVTDMDYTPRRTTVRTVGKTTTTHTSPPKHKVYIDFEKTGDQNFDHEKLYQTVRIDDNVTAEYQEVYRVEKANPRNREFMYVDFVSITSEKGRKVDM